MGTQPVSMLSFTIQVPWTSTASQGITMPLAGMAMTSPGTSSVDMACSISAETQRLALCGDAAGDSVKPTLVSSAHGDPEHAVGRHHVAQHHILLERERQRSRRQECYERRREPREPTFLMVYSEVAMEIKDIKTIAEA